MAAAGWRWHSLGRGILSRGLHDLLQRGGVAWGCYIRHQGGRPALTVNQPQAPAWGSAAGLADLVCVTCSELLPLENEATYLLAIHLDASRELQHAHHSYPQRRIAFMCVSHITHARGCASRGALRCHDGGALGTPCGSRHPQQGFGTRQVRRMHLWHGRMPWVRYGEPVSFSSPSFPGCTCSRCSSPPFTPAGLLLLPSQDWVSPRLPCVLT